MGTEKKMKGEADNCIKSKQYSEFKFSSTPPPGKKKQGSLSTTY